MLYLSREQKLGIRFDVANGYGGPSTGSEAILSSFVIFEGKLRLVMEPKPFDVRMGQTCRYSCQRLAPRPLSRELREHRRRSYPRINEQGKETAIVQTHGMLVSLTMEFADDAGNNSVNWSCRIGGAACRKGPNLGVAMGVFLVGRRQK